MITMLLYIFGTFFFLIAMMNILISWWIKTLFHQGKGHKRSHYYAPESRRKQQHDHFQTNENNKSTPSTMVRCHTCGTYCPEENTFSKNGKRFCSVEHRDLDS